MEIVLLVIGLLVGAVAGYFIAASRKPVATEDAQAPLIELARVSAIAQERQNTIDELRAQLVQRDQAADRENKVLQSLSPVAKQLEDMQRKVNDLETQRAAQYGKLEAGLLQQLEASNQLRSQTVALAKAMSDKTTRGQWGEVQLERIVEAAGLVNRVDFVTQSVTKNSDGDTIKPDMVIQLPGKRAIPVDSKVPFDAYLEAMSFDDPTNPDHIASRKRLLDKHVADLRGHIKALGSKKYWEGYVNAADYVVAFIPSESLLAAAMEHDPTLGEYAMSNKVALATPQNLFSLLKTIALIWQNTTDQEALNHVISLGKDLFSRLRVVAEHAEKVGGHLDKAAKSYNEFVSSMERNLLTTARSLNSQEAAQFGSVEIPELKQVETTTKHFTKPELIGLESGESEADSNELDE